MGKKAKNKGGQENSKHAHKPESGVCKPKLRAGKKPAHKSGKNPSPQDIIDRSDLVVEKLKTFDVYNNEEWFKKDFGAWKAERKNAFTQLVLADELFKKEVHAEVVAAEIIHLAKNALTNLRKNGEARGEMWDRLCHIFKVKGLQDKFPAVSTG